MSTGQTGKAHVQVAQCLGVCVCKMEYVLFKKPYLIDRNMTEFIVFMLSDMPTNHLMW